MLMTKAFDRLDANLFAPNRRESPFITDLRRAITGTETPSFQLTRGDFPLLQRAFRDVGFASLEQQARAIANTTKTMLELGIFDKSKSAGIAPKRFCQWIGECAHIMTESTTSPETATYHAIENLINSSLDLAFSTNNDLDGESPEALKGWSSALADLSSRHPLIKSAIRERLGTPSSLKTDFARKALIGAFESPNISETLAALSERLNAFVAAISNERPAAEARERGMDLLSAVTALPPICIPKGEQPLGVFEAFRPQSAGAENGSGAKGGIPTPKDCAWLLMRSLNSLVDKEEYRNVIVEVTTAVTQTCCENQFEYDDMAEDVCGLRGFGTNCLHSLVEGFSAPSPMLPPAVAAEFSFHEPSGLRTKNAFDGVIELAGRLGEHPDQDHYKRCIDDFLRCWRSPLVDFSECSQHEAEAMQKVLDAGLSLFDQMPESVDDLTILYDTAFFAHDASLRRRLQGAVLEKLLESMKPADALAFIFDRRPRQLQYGLTLGTLSSIDSSLREPREFVHVEGRLKQVWSSSTEMASNAGVAVLADAASQALKNIDRTQLLSAIISSRHDDTDLKSLILQGWFLLDRASVQQLIQALVAANSSEEVERALAVFRKETRSVADIDARIEQPARLYEFQTPNVWLQQLYSLGPFERMAILRDTLAGPGGILTQNGGRRKIVDILFNELLQTDTDSELTAQLRRVTDAFTESASDDQLSELLVGILADNVLVPPEKPSEWGDRFRDFLDDHAFLWSETEPGMLIDPKQTSPNDQFKGSRWFYLERAAAEKVEARTYAFLLAQMLPLIEGAQDKTSAATLQKIQKLGIFAHERDGQQKLAPLDFITQVGSRMDAPGVRMLQLVGQLISEIDPEVRTRLSDLYDARHGQSAISAWQTIGKVSPSFRAKIESLGPMLGGGSIYTVFLGQIAGKGQEALRVMNPNALGHVQERMELLRKTLDRLIGDDDSYARVLPILNLVGTWIETEMKDREFATLDPKFRKDWNGWSPDWAKKLKLSVRIPESRQVHNVGDETVIKVARDEFIPGVTNFTHADTLPEETRKAMAALGVQFYLAQIIGKNPLGESLILSDISKGNAGITSDQKQLAVFDRGMYLKLSFGEKMQLKSVIDAKTPDGITRAIVNLLQSFSENSARSAEDLAKEIGSFMEAHRDTPDKESLVFQGLSHLFCQGVHIPLKWNLLLKNINAWKQMVTEAGFSSLQEALAYKGD
jgi:hypothetical protein